MADGDEVLRRAAQGGVHRVEALAQGSEHAAGDVVVRIVEVTCVQVDEQQTASGQAASRVVERCLLLGALTEPFGCERICGTVANGRGSACLRW